jgi:hypothetical protein
MVATVKSSKVCATDAACGPESLIGGSTVGLNAVGYVAAAATIVFCVI